MDGNVIAALIFAAIIWGAIVSLGVMRFKPNRAEVEEIADSRIIAHQDELSKLFGTKVNLKADTSGFMQRLEHVTSAVENAASEMMNPIQAPCADCGSVFVATAMQHIAVFVDWRDQHDPEYLSQREKSTPLFYCPAHTKPYEVAARQCYRYRYDHSINELRADERKRDKLPLWRYYNIVPAQPERWDEVHGVAEPVKVKVKRGRKSAADKAAEAEQAADDAKADAADPKV